MDLFGTAGIRGEVQSWMTPSLALSVGKAASQLHDEFVLGWDGRETSRGLAAAVESGLLSGGASVVRIGQVPTPTLAFASRNRHGIMITASHNPPHDNGIKLFVNGMEYDTTNEALIDSAVHTDLAIADWDRWGSSTSHEILESYQNAIVDYVTQLGEWDDLREVSVVVDCGNGMAAKGTPQVLRRLGASVITLNANIDGHFPGRQSKPTPESLHDIQGFMRDGSYSFGIAHDGDADRIVILDETGTIVHEDTILAILAEFYVKRHTGTTPVVITTPNASARIDDRVEHQGGQITRVPLGGLHEGFQQSRQDETIVFAAEPWKHIHPPLGDWIDGIVSAGLLTCLIGTHGLDTLREPIDELPYRKVSVDCPEDLKDSVMERLQTDLPEFFSDATSDDEHGIRLSFQDKSWILVRPSGTEPVIRIYIESSQVDPLLEKTVEFIASVRDEI